MEVHPNAVVCASFLRPIVDEEEVKTYLLTSTPQQCCISILVLFIQKLLQPKHQLSLGKSLTTPTHPHGYNQTPFLLEGYTHTTELFTDDNFASFEGMYMCTTDGGGYSIFLNVLPEPDTSDHRGITSTRRLLPRICSIKALQLLTCPPSWSYTAKLKTRSTPLRRTPTINDK